MWFWIDVGAARVWSVDLVVTLFVLNLEFVGYDFWLLVFWFLVLLRLSLLVCYVAFVEVRGCVYCDLLFLVFVVACGLFCVVQLVRGGWFW